MLKTPNLLKIAIRRFAGPIAQSFFASVSATGNSNDEASFYDSLAFEQKTPLPYSRP